MAKKSFLIVGAGRFGSAVAETLFAAGHEVVVVDRDATAIDKVMSLVTESRSATTSRRASSPPPPRRTRARAASSPRRCRSSRPGS
jgi:3-hydroxyacyl-CoA dehydrogenase